MGLKIHTLAEIPENVSKSYYLYILDYHNWNEPIGNTLRENFDKIAEFAAKNDSVVIQGMSGSLIYTELMSWKAVNGIDPVELLPALMITTLHPKYFLDSKLAVLGINMSTLIEEPVLFTTVSPPLVSIFGFITKRLIKYFE